MHALQQDLQSRLVAQQAEGLGQNSDVTLRHCGASVAASWLVVEHCAVSALVVLGTSWMQILKWRRAGSRGLNACDQERNGRGHGRGCARRHACDCHDHGRCGRARCGHDRCDRGRCGPDVRRGLQKLQTFSSVPEFQSIPTVACSMLNCSPKHRFDALDHGACFLSSTLGRTCSVAIVRPEVSCHT